MSQDWFAANAPKAQSTTSGDWFATNAPKASPSMPADRSWGDTAADVGIGVAKGVGNTVFGLGKMVHDYTPIGRISDAIQPHAFEQRPPEITPSNTPQKVGFGAEQLGEFFIPTGVAGSAPKLARTIAETGKAGALTLAQTGSPVAAGASAAISAAVPGVAGLSNSLREGAEKSVVQALGPTKEWAKAEAKKLAPQMIDRGVSGSRAAMLKQAQANVASLGPKIGAAIDDAANAGAIIDGRTVQSALQQAKQGLMVEGMDGVVRPIEGAQKVVKKLDKLTTFIDNIGPAIPVERAQVIKQAWGKIVNKAGLYGQKAGSAATDNPDAWAVREAYGAIKPLLEKATPDLAEINKEYAFWRGLRNVLTETEQRTQSHGGGLVANATGAASFGGAVAAGHPVAGLVLAPAARQAVKVMQSPWWRTSVSAPLKNQMAQALASGNGQLIEAISKNIVSALPAEAKLAFAQ